MTALATADEILIHAVDRGDIPGVVAFATTGAGILYGGAFGQRALGQPVPMTQDTVFHIASMTKPVTAVAALQLVEQGRFSLDEPLGERFPDLGGQQVLDGFDRAGLPTLRPPRRPITLRHLLTHTAGFGYAVWDADLARYEDYLGVPLLPPVGPLVFDPGERWEYGINLDWVGMLIERVSGQSLEDYFRAHIFAPLGMTDTSFVLRDDQRARLAGRHQRESDGTLHLVDVEIPARPATFNGGGGLYATGPDYVRFLRMLLNGGRLGAAQILQPDSVAELARNHIGDLAVEVMRSVALDRSNDVEFFPGTIKRWSLGGLLTTEVAPTGRSAGSWAWGGMFNTFFWLDPVRDVAGLILTQLLPFCDTPTLALFEHFETDVYRSLAGRRSVSDR